MTHTRVHSQYSTGVSRHNIEQALIAAGKDFDHLQPSAVALGPLFWPARRDDTNTNTAAVTQLLLDLGVEHRAGRRSVGARLPQG
jgi:hypothetical protein